MQKLPHERNARSSTRIDGELTRELKDSCSRALMLDAVAQRLAADSIDDC